MSIKALDWAMDAPVNDPLAKLVLIVVANHHNQSHGFAWPSVAHMCHVTGASDATVRRKLKLLEEMGLIFRQYRTGRSTEYHLAFDTPVTVTPLSDRQDTPVTQTGITLKEPLNKNSAKQKLVDWSPTDKDRIYAKERGLDPDAVLESIRLWNQQNGNKAAYSDCGAFWMNWCRREAERKPKAVSGHSRPFNGQSSEWSPPQRKMVTLEQWKKLSDNMRTYYKQNRPDVIAELRGLGADV